MLPTPDEEGEDVEDDTIAPEVILNSGSVLNTIVDVCILLHFCLFINREFIVCLLFAVTRFPD